jgi:hypothetical protein
MSVVLDLTAPARTLSTKPESLTAKGPAGTLNNGVTKEEIVEAFIQISAYAGAARVRKLWHRRRGLRRAGTLTKSLVDLVRGRTGGQFAHVHS